MEVPQIIVGPPTAKVSRTQAEEKLLAHPLFPKGAAYALDSVQGHWVAAFTHESAPPDAFADGGGPGQTLDGPPEPSEAPKGPDETPEVDSEGEDKPKGDKKDKGGEKGELGEIKELLTVLLTALGLGPDGLGPDANPVPGADEGPPPPPPDAPGADNKTHTVHERALKPGESPPGTTPVGAPAFAHVREDHPWKGILGVKKTFKIEEPIGDDESISAIASELKGLAEETGSYQIEQLGEFNSNGRRIAHALVVAK